MGLDDERAILLSGGGDGSIVATCGWSGSTVLPETPLASSVPVNQPFFLFFFSKGQYPSKEASR